MPLLQMNDPTQGEFTDLAPELPVGQSTERVHSFLYNTNTSLHPLTPEPQASELQKEPPTPKVCRLQMDHNSILLVTACCGLAPGEIPGR